MAPFVTFVAFDFDGTLSEDEMTVLLGNQVGVGSEIAAVTERAMAGELTYADSLRERVALLEGLTLADMNRAFEAVSLRPGATDVLRALKQVDVPVVILTGGFERGVTAALERAGIVIDRLVANRLVDDGTVLTGAVEGPLIEGTKDEAMRTMAEEFGVPLAATVAVGDGANDVPMLAIAGLAVGFAPTPAVEEVVDVTVGTMAELERLFERRGLLDNTESAG